jgi:hypothetical protein
VLEKEGQPLSQESHGRSVFSVESSTQSSAGKAFSVSSKEDQAIDNQDYEDDY